MKLPNNEIGVSDLLAWRECPRRMKFGMQRHTPRTYSHPETGKEITFKDPPEGQGTANAFGSAFHDAAELIETELLSIEEALRVVFPAYVQWLTPSDLALLKSDLEALATRDYRGVRTIVAEDDWRVPLCEHEGETIYFRFKLDRLYQVINSPSAFVQIDYKSSRYQKTQEEWNEDIQQKAYNWGVPEVFPECESLMQVVDQLRFGPVTLRRRTDEEREEIRAFLSELAIAVIEDDEHRPKWNQWCAFCPLKVDCPVVDELTEFARTTISVIAPIEQDGRKKKVALDVLTMDDYVEQMEKAADAEKVLTKFVEAVKGALKAMPEDNRDALGYGVRGKKAYYFTSQSLEDVHEALGDAAFYAMVSLTKSSLESHLADQPAVLEKMLSLMDEKEGAVSIVKT